MGEVNIGKLKKAFSILTLLIVKFFRNYLYYDQGGQMIGKKIIPACFYPKGYLLTYKLSEEIKILIRHLIGFIYCPKRVNEKRFDISL